MLPAPGPLPRFSKPDRAGPGRFLDWLVESGNLAEYMQRLIDAYNPVAARNVMCRNTVSVGWDGQLYDCDFNQMLELGVAVDHSAHIRDFDAPRFPRRILRMLYCSFEISKSLS